MQKINKSVRYSSCFTTKCNTGGLTTQTISNKFDRPNYLKVCMKASLKFCLVCYVLYIKLSFTKCDKTADSNETNYTNKSQNLETC